MCSASVRPSLRWPACAAATWCRAPGATSRFSSNSAAIAPDPAFGPDDVAYRLTGARTLSLGAGLAYELSKRASLEAFLSTDDTRARGGLDYDVQRISVSYAYRQ